MTVRTRPLACLLAVALAAGAGVVGAAGPTRPAAAQEDTAPPPTTTTAPASPPPEIEVAARIAVAFFRNQQRLGELDGQRAEVESRLVTAEAALHETVTRIAATEAQIDVLETQLRGRAADVYKRHGSRITSVLAIDHVLDVRTGEHYANRAAAVGNDDLEQLETLHEELDGLRARQDEARASLASDKERLDAIRTDLATEAYRQGILLARVGGIPLLGPAELGAADLAGWLREGSGRARLADGTMVEELAAIYLEEGAAEHVRGDLAFAQSVVETGSFSVAPGNNFAGIGTCDSCDHGLAFPTPRDGVRAQIQLLRSYADPDSRAASLANPPQPDLFGANPLLAAIRYDTFFKKGSAPLWNVMGNGNWATDPAYAGKVIAVYAAMLGYRTLHAR